MAKRMAALLMLLLVTGCGNKVDLRPRAGSALPPAPAGSATTPTPSDMMTPSPEARPQRSDELLRRSETRADDPFDLPPKD